MTTFKNKIALIIPTRNRPDLLTELLHSIHNQTIKPDQVIIVDGSDRSIEPAIKSFLSSEISYVRVFPPGLTKQRNAGIKALNKDITLAGYLDDDIVLETDAIESMLRFWEDCPEDIGGTSFNITNNPTRNPITNIVTNLFGIESSIPGKVLSSGFNTGVNPLQEDTYVEWLCGGATIWRREILEEYKFDEWYAGWAYHEDVDFSFKVAQKYRLVVLYAAKLQHNPPPFNQNKNRSLGKMAVINRYHFVKKNAQLSVPLFYWATIGEILIHILQTIWERNLGGTLLAFGNISALFHIIKGDLAQVDENFRK